MFLNKCFLSAYIAYNGFLRFLALFWDSVFSESAPLGEKIKVW